MPEITDSNLKKVFSTNKLLQKTEVPFVANFKNYGGLRTKGWTKTSQPGLPLITIVTVVRNDVTHLERTMLSVLNQTYPNVEYIVVDGASTDGTLEVIKRYAEHLDFWVSESDKGSHEAINKGIDLMKGDWVNFMHSGDYFYENETFEKIFLKNKIEADVVYGDCIGLVSPTESAIFKSDQTTDRFWQGQVFCQEAVFVKTHLVRQNPFSTDYRVSSDYNFFMDCLLGGAKFQKVDVIVFTVGTLGVSDRHWLRARFENWKIARRFNKPIITDLFHLKGIVYDITFRIFKGTLGRLHLYEPLKNLYRKTIKGFLTRNSTMKRL
jgi:glycosyltransferase involved in cell wall biosynthesis